MMAGFQVRVGDQDDYHDEDMDGVVDRLQMNRVRGPLHPYVCSSSWADPSIRGKVIGVESHDCRRNNYISLFVPDGNGEFGRSISEEELAELNSRLSKVKDDYPDGECPDCGETIPDDAWVGDSCGNCEHVFTGDVVVDD